jgi:hypothetical protein
LTSCLLLVAAQVAVKTLELAALVGLELLLVH